MAKHHRGNAFRSQRDKKAAPSLTLAGSAIPREARQTGTRVRGTLRVDTLGPLRNVTVMETSCTIVDGALGFNSFK